MPTPPDSLPSAAEMDLLRRRAEESEQRYHNLIADSPTSIAILQGPQMVVTIANDAILESWGKGREVIGKPLGEIMPEAVAQGFFDLLLKVYTTGEPFYGHEQKVHLKRRGQWEDVYYNFVYQPNRDLTGAIAGVTIIANEVTPQALLNLKIAANETQLRLALEAAGLGAWTYDPTIDTLSWDDRCKEIFGLPEGMAVNYPLFLSAIHPEDREHVNQQAYTALAPGGSGHYAVEYRIRRLNDPQQERWIRANGKIIGDKEKEIPYFLGTVQDITEEKTLTEALENKVRDRTLELHRNNEELLNTNRKLEQFAYVASHDLQEPLRKIRTFVNLLGRNLHDPATAQTYFGKIDTSAERMSALIQDVLRYSRLAKEEDDIAPTDLNEVLKNVETDFELLIAEKNARIVLDNLLPVVPGISIQLYQLLSNLISNALKFSEEAPLILIASRLLSLEETQRIATLDPIRRYAEITIQDNGIGFEQQFAERIFNIFQRLENRQYSGTGIGLALCKRIVENHHGHILAESAPGAGAMFKVYLPT